MSSQRPLHRVWMLAVATFVVGTDGFVFAGLLPVLAREFEVTVGEAGQVTTVFALAYAFSAPVTATLAQSWPRRRVLVTALAVFTLGNALSAVAPSFAVLLFSRVVAALGAALVTPTSTMIATALTDATRRGRAIALVTSGLTVATALGAPAGTLAGATIGWRGTMGMIALGGAATGVLLAVSLPPIAGSARRSLRDRFSPLRARSIRWLLATTLVAFTSVYLFCTYVATVYAPLARGVFLAVILGTIGISGTIGNILAGRLSDRFRPSATVIVALTLIALVAVPAALSTTRVMTIVTAAVYGLAAFAIIGPQQHRLIALDTERTGLPVAINASAIYLAVALAGAVGGALTAAPTAFLPLAISSTAVVAIAVSTRAQSVAQQ